MTNNATSEWTDLEERLTRFLSKLELPQEKLHFSDPAASRKKAYVETSLEALFPGATHDFVALLVAILSARRHMGSESERAMAEEARLALDHLVTALEALDAAGRATRDFTRSYESLVKYIGMPIEARHGDVQGRVETIARHMADQPGRRAARDMADFTLHGVLLALCPWAFTSPDQEVTFSDQQNPFQGDGHLDLSRSLVNSLRMRNHAAHRFLPTGTRTVPQLHELLVSLAAIVLQPDYQSALHAHLGRIGGRPFLVAPYLERLRRTCVLEAPRFLRDVVSGIDEVPRRVAVRSEVTRNAYEECDAIDMIRNFDRICLIGEGGAGKTSFLKQLTRAMVDSPSERLLPITVELRYYRPHEAAGTLEAHMRRVLELPAAVAWPVLEDWTPVLVMDGFNEVSLEYQSGLLHELQAITTTWPHLRVVVASRTRPEGDWREASLRPVTEAMAWQYLGQLRKGEHGLNVTRFWAELGQRSYGELVKGNLLLLTMMAAHALSEHGQQLPASEMVSFQSLVEGYYRRECEEKQPNQASTVLATREAFGRIALVMLERGELVLGRVDVETILAGVEALAQHPNRVRPLLESGFMEQVGDRFTFWHQSFFNFFAAEALAKRPYDGAQLREYLETVYYAAYEDEASIARVMARYPGNHFVEDLITEHTDELGRILYYTACMKSEAFKLSILKHMLGMDVAVEIEFAVETKNRHATTLNYALIRAAVRLLPLLGASAAQFHDDLVHLVREGADLASELGVLALSAVAEARAPEILPQLMALAPVVPDVTWEALDLENADPGDLRRLRLELCLPAWFSRMVYYWARIDASYTFDQLIRLVPLLGVEDQLCDRTHEYFFWQSEHLSRHPDESDEDFEERLDSWDDTWRGMVGVEMRDAFMIAMASCPDAWERLFQLYERYPSRALGHMFTCFLTTFVPKSGARNNSFALEPGRGAKSFARFWFAAPAPHSTDFARYAELFNAHVAERPGDLGRMADRFYEAWFYRDATLMEEERQAKEHVRRFIAERHSVTDVEAFVRARAEERQATNRIRFEEDW